MSNVSQTNEKVRQVIFDYISKKINSVENLPWQKPWSVTGDLIPHNFTTKNKYRGINFLLGMIAPYEVKAFLTWKQVESLGEKVLPEEAKNWMPILHAKKIYWLNGKSMDQYKYNKLSDEDKEKCTASMMLRYFRVYNIAQTTIKYVPKVEDVKGEAIGEADNFLNAYNEDCPISIQLSDRAFYRPSTDQIVLPKREQFNSINEFYATAFHEIVHSTGHAKRLSREGVVNIDYFGSHQYASEELVAEFGAAMLCQKFGIFNVVRDNSAAYIQGWKKRIKDNPNILTDALTNAEKAIEYIDKYIK